jgi:predicted HAD superfamily Cof-like phosphohydrolase
VRFNFDDVGDFHRKFGLHNVTYTAAEPVEYTDDLIKFRLKFLLEELQEIVEGCGYCVAHVSEPQGGSHLEAVKKPNGSMKHEAVFDGLLDLAYVTFGMAHVLGYPWQDGWDEVQRANITKERCGINHTYIDSGHQDYEGCVSCGKPREQHSLRGSAYDVIKPRGWHAPDIKSILKRVGFILGG